VGYANQEATYWSSKSLAEDYSGDAIDVHNCKSGTMSLTWADAAATDAVVKLQESLDKTTWIDIASQTKTIGAAAGSHIYKLTSDVLLSPYIRAVIVDNTESAGTATIKYFFKGDR
jgi:hypothetical protein